MESLPIGGPRLEDMNHTDDQEKRPGLTWLDSLFSPPASITVLTGPSGCGKTGLCLRAVAAAHEAGLTVRGVLSPGRYDAGGRRIGIDLLDPASGERRSLATQQTPDPITGRSWRFSPESLHHGAALLANSGACDLLVIDELGPVELLDQRGWANALDVLRTGAYGRALVVVRPGLVEIVMSRLAPLPVYTLTLPLLSS